MRSLSKPFGQMQEITFLLANARQKGLGIVGVNVGNAGAGLGQVGIVRLLYVAYNSAIKPARPCIAEKLDTLAGGRASQQALAFDVARQRRQQIGPPAPELSSVR